MRIFLLMVISATVLGTFSFSSQASCVGPQVRTVRAAAPGNTITVRGDHWAAECNDVIACSIGCLGKETCTGGEPTPPAQNLRILLATVAPKHDRIELSSGVDATANTFTVEHDVGLPENLDPGRYRVLMGNEALGSYRSDIIVIERRPAP